MLLDQHFVGCSSSPEVGQLSLALVKAQAGYKPVAKSEEYRINDQKSYRYSTWKDICEALYPSLLANGLAFIPRMSPTANGWLMVGTLIHAESGEWITSVCPIRDSIDGHGTRSDPQSFEIGTTYAKKCLLMTLAGGWAAGDEVEEQDSAAVSEQVQQVDQEAEKFAAIREKAETRLRLIAKDKAKVEATHDRLLELVANGEMREEDAQWLIETYPVPEEKAPKKEKTSA